MVMMDVEIPTGYEACENREGDAYCLKQVTGFRVVTKQDALTIYFCKDNRV